MAKKESFRYGARACNNHQSTGQIGSMYSYRQFETVTVFWFLHFEKVSTERLWIIICYQYDKDK